MRRPIAGVLLLLGPILSACSSFGSSGSTPDTDAAPASDGGSSGTDAGLTFCQRNTGAIFCDDFEVAGRDVSKPTPWDDFAGSMDATTFSIADGFESVAGLRVAGTFEPLEGRFLRKVPSVVPSQGLRWTFRLRVSKLAKYVSVGQAQLAVAGFEFEGGKNVRYILHHADTGPEDLTGLVATTLVPAGSTNSFENFDQPPVGLRTNQWVDIRIELQPQGPDTMFRFFFGTTKLSEVTYPAAASTTLALGAMGYADGGDAEIAFDDVLVTAL